MEKFIKSYLRQGLIDVGDNEKRLQTLSDTAASLVTDFAGDRRLLVRFIRSTLVPSIDPESTVLQKISEMVEASWATFVTRSPELRTAMLIAVGWQAVLDLAESTPTHLPLIWYASANAIERGDIDETAKPVVAHVQPLGETLEKRACEQWRSCIDKPTKQVSPVAVPEAKNVLTKHLLAAVTSTDAGGTSIENGNSNPMDGTAAWGQHFAKNASQAITLAISAQQNSAIVAVQKSLDDLTKKFNVIRDEAIRSHQAQNRRTELLWLAESQYSPRFGRGYAEFNGKESVAALAFDIAEIASGISPVSVEHFLAAQSAKFASTSDFKVESFVKELAKGDVLPCLPDALKTPLDDVPQFGLLEAAGEISRNALPAAQIFKRLGFPKSKSMTVQELTRTLFREIKCLEFMGVKLWP